MKQRIPYRHSLYLILPTFLLLIGCQPPTQASTEISKPNILFIAIDDLRPELNCYGSDYMVTPNLDRLASEGRLFTNHFVQVPTCGASRRALLTGLRPTAPIHLRNQVMFETMANQPEQEQPESFAHLFRRNGYYTMAYGKISHSPDGYVYAYPAQISDTLEMPHSWDEVYGPYDEWKTGWRSFFAYVGGKNRIDENQQVKPYEMLDVEDEAYPDGRIAQKAVEQLETLKEKKQPFLMAVGFYKPHLPFCAPKKYWDLYDRETLEISPNPFAPEGVHPASLNNLGEFNNYKLGEERAEKGKKISDRYAKKLRHAYFASVSYVDAQVGKLLDELERLDLRKNTIIVVWGDHGWNLGDHTMWGKHTLFERSLKSAFMISTPNMAEAGKASDRIIETVDIYPTLADLCDINAPNELSGKSLVPLLKNPESEWEEAAFGYFRKGISVRTPQYRLNAYAREDMPNIELFDHYQDPNETQNIAAENPGVVKGLMEKYNLQPIIAD